MHCANLAKESFEEVERTRRKLLLYVMSYFNMMWQRLAMPLRLKYGCNGQTFGYTCLCHITLGCLCDTVAFITLKYE